MKVVPNGPCPCGSDRKLKHCCRPLHRGQRATTPEALMRSRYTAYALGEVEYILSTTHPAGPQFQADPAAWAENVRGFCGGTQFDGLEVLSAAEEGDTGWVAFRARLRQAGQDASFGERSTFLREAGRWLYHSGDALEEA